MKNVFNFIGLNSWFCNKTKSDASSFAFESKLTTKILSFDKEEDRIELSIDEEILSIEEESLSKKNINLVEKKEKKKYQPSK